MFRGDAGSPADCCNLASGFSLPQEAALFRQQLRSGLCLMLEKGTASNMPCRPLMSPADKLNSLAAYHP